MVVQAAIPLLVELGPSVTTLQIARAAGISEPTIFRAFEDKNELLAACLAEVTAPGHVVDSLKGIDADLPLPHRLVAVIETVRAQGERTGAVANAVQLAGATRARHHESLSEEERGRLAQNRIASYTRLRTAVAEVFDPDQDAGDLRMPAEDVATLLLGIVMALGRSGGWDTGPASVTTDGLADLILHGIAESRPGPTSEH